MTKALLTLILCVVAVATVLEVKLAADQHQRLMQESHATTK
jgi:hypothetical protein